MPVVSGNTWGDYHKKKLPSGGKTKNTFSNPHQLLFFFWYVLFYLIKALSFLNSPVSVLEKTNKQTNIYIYIHIYIYINIYTRHFSKFSLLLTQLCLMGAMDMEKHRKGTCFQSMVVVLFLRQQQVDFLFIYTAFCHETKSIQIHFGFTLPFSFLLRLPFLPLYFHVVLLRCGSCGCVRASPAQKWL